LGVTPETKEALRALYHGLHSEFSADDVEFDRTVRNPGRIFRLYGTVNRKGSDTPERPHRRSTCWIPPEWRQVTQRQVAQLASYYARQQPSRKPTPESSSSPINGRGDYRTLDVVAWFQAHGLYKRPLPPGKHAVTCPWADEHSTPDHPEGTDSVIWEGDGGWPTFHCSHAHCEGRGIREVMQILGDADHFCGQQWQGGQAS